MGSLWIYFAAGSALIAWFSWTVSIRSRRIHGFAKSSS
jgi:hypothetical protein